MKQRLHDFFGCRLDADAFAFLPLARRVETRRFESVEVSKVIVDMTMGSVGFAAT